MNIVTEKFLSTRDNVKRFDEFKVINGKKYQRVSYDYAMGYQARLRNLRNIINANLDADVLKAHVIDVIADPKRVAESKQLPYDFKEAYNIVKSLDSKVATAVSKAIDASVTNIPQMGQRVWLIVDYSGSMGNVSSETSAMSSALFLAAALLKANEGSDKLAVTMFGSSAKTIHGVDTNNSLLAISQILESYRRGSIAGSTDFDAALKEYKNIGFVPDTVIVLTDGEVNHFPYSNLTSTARGAVKLTVNLSAATSTPFVANDGWYTMAGWSPAMFKWFPAIREKETVVDQLSVPYIGVPARKGS